jgi:hypothetical protein
VMDQTLTIHPLANARGAQQFRRSLFEDAGAHPRLDVFAGLGFQDDVVDPRQGQQVAESQPSRSRSDNRDSGAHRCA